MTKHQGGLLIFDKQMCYKLLTDYQRQISPPPPSVINSECSLQALLIYGKSFNLNRILIVISTVLV